MKVIAYLRVSTTEQEQSGLGLIDQENRIRAYCGLYDLEIVEVIQDAASGKNLDRPGLKKAMAMLDQGKADGLIVAKLDRLTRSVKDMGTLLEDYFTEKNSFFVVAEQIDTRTAGGRLLLNLLTSVAQWERETIGERTKAALSVKKAKMEKTGGHVPFGYDCNNGKLTANAQEQKAISRIRELRAKGRTFQEIADTLNKQGVQTKLGKTWTKAHVFKIYQKVA